MLQEKRVKPDAIKKIRFLKKLFDNELFEIGQLWVLVFTFDDQANTPKDV